MRVGWKQLAGVGLVLVLAGFPASANTAPGTTPTNVSNTSGDAMTPAVAVAADGMITIAWAESDSRVYAVRSTGATLPPGIAVALGHSPALAAAQNTTNLVWVDRDFSGNDEIYLSNWSDSAWSVPANVSSTSGASTMPDVAVSITGTAHIVWSDTTPETPTIYEGTLTANLPVSNATGFDPAVAIETNGRLHLVWQDDFEPADIYYTHSIGTDGWSLPESVSLVASDTAQTPALAVASSGTVHVVWQEGGDIQYGNNQAGPWSIPVIISGPDGAAAHPRVALDGTGRLHAVWVRAGRSVMYASRSPEGTWSTPVTLADMPDGLSDPALAVETGGTIHAVWSGRPAPGANREVYWLKTRPVAFTHQVYLPLVQR